jgi:hypothetical protein
MEKEATMSVYSIVLFFHIAGALGFFIVQGLEWMGLSQLRSAKLPEEAHAILGLVKRTDRLGALSILTIIVTGVYMMLTVWGGVPWILVVLGSLVLEIVIFVVLSRPRITAVEQALDMETFHRLVNHPILWISIYTRTAILLGIVFLKVAKPNLGGSLLTIGIAITLGLALAFPDLRHERIQPGPAARVVVALIVTALVAAIGLLAANSIPAGAFPFSKTKSEVQDLRTERTEVPAGVGSSTLPTQAPTASPKAALQEGPLILQARCTQCHSLEKIQQAKKTRAEWEQTLSEMESYNAKISDAEKKVLLDYLSPVNHP